MPAHLAAADRTGRATVQPRVATVRNDPGGAIPAEAQFGCMPLQRPGARAFVFAAVLVTSASAFIAPAAVTVEYLFETDARVPSYAHRLHRDLSHHIVPWAYERIETGIAETVPLYAVAPTEWPVFTAVFFLNASEELHEQGFDVSYAADAAQACRDLLMDPAHHSWVRRHWGDDYLHDNNVFFRSLLISGMTSFLRLSEDLPLNVNPDDRPFLEDQVHTLASILDASPHGVLEDYPNETYPIDVLVTIGYIAHADEVLGTDHSAFIRRARRAFVAPHDDELGLPRFRVDLPPGGAAPENLQPSRGIGNSWITMYAPDLWPDDAARWFTQHERHFWQDQGWAQGYRELPRSGPLQWGDWTMEIDAGPILDGFGTAASAFGIGAARRNGRLDHAATLSAQMLAVSAPDGFGGLRAPRILSDTISGGHAALLGESALLFFSVLQPAAGVEIVQGGTVTPLVLSILAFELGMFSLICLSLMRRRERAFGPCALVFATLGLLALGMSSLVATALAFFGLLAGRPPAGDESQPKLADTPIT